MILDEKKIAVRKIPIIHSTLSYRKWGDLENSRIVGLSSTKRNYNAISQISKEARSLIYQKLSSVNVKFQNSR